MKKKLFILFLFILGFFSLYAEQSIEISGKIIHLEDSLEKIKEKFGSEEEYFEIPFEYNSDWDSVCYRYENFTVYTYRVTEMPYCIAVFGNDFVLDINNEKINGNSKKQEIESLLGEELEFDYKDKNNNLSYIHYLPDFIEVAFVFDENEVLQKFCLQYVPMD